LDEETLLDVIGVFMPNVDLTRARETLEKRLKNEESRMDTAALLARQALQGQDGEGDEEEVPDEDDDVEEKRRVFRRLGSLLRGAREKEQAPSGNGGRERVPA
jgi:hypothetical protein